MNKIVYNKTRETEMSNPKLDLKILKKKSSGNTSAGIVLGYIKKLKNNNAPLDFIILLQQLYKDIYNLETAEKFKAENWKGKSSIKFLVYPSKVICVTYQKFEKDGEPKEIKTELTKDEINKVINAINKLYDGDELIFTSDIAELVYNKPWKQVFASRKQHIILTKILNYLEYKNLINYYRSGKVQVLKKLQIQKELK